MGRRFAELLFTDAVKREQEAHGSRHQYARLEAEGVERERLGEAETEFIETRDSFYMAVLTEMGWPYVQHRGGHKGFLRVLDGRQIGFADLRGNRQYISVGSLKHDDRVTMIMVDYPTRSRLKLAGRAMIYEGDAAANKWLERLIDPTEQAKAERAVVISVEAFDWNCQQHITPRYTEEEIRQRLEPVWQRARELEAENRRLHGELEELRPKKQAL